MSDYNQLFDSNFADSLVQNTEVYAPITIEEILIIMIIVQKQYKNKINKQVDS